MVFLQLGIRDLMLSYDVLPAPDFQPTKRLPETRNIPRIHNKTPGIGHYKAIDKREIPVTKKEPQRLDDDSNEKLAKKRI